ncbi:DUF6232 family protein [Actinophytocola sp. KF-1]
MALSHEAINVRVSQRILWFGSEAYPLPNITRTNTLTLQPNRGALIRQYVLSVLVTLFVMGIAGSAAPGSVAALVILGGLAWLAYRTYRLVELLKLTLYVLNIETAAGSHRGLTTDNPNVVADLQLRITDAINNPHAEFQMQVENFHVGDNFTMFGNNTVSRAAR